MMDEEFFNFYVGTYTSGESQGIYQYAISSEGKLKKMGLKAEAENPSFLTFDKSRQYLLAVNEVSNEESVGYVSSFKIDKDSLFLINQRSSGGSHPCHITINS